MDEILYPNNAVTEVSIRLYRLEPGDGTAYSFALGPAPLASLGYDQLGQRMGFFAPDHVISGIGDGTDFYLIASLMQSSNFIYTGRVHSLRHPHAPFAGYLSDHVRFTGDILGYSTAAILLACSRLIDEPNDIPEALRRMLYAPIFYKPE